MSCGALPQIWQMRWGRARQTMPATLCVRRESRWLGRWRAHGRQFAVPFLVKALLMSAGRLRVVTGKAMLLGAAAVPAGKRLPIGKRPMRTVVRLQTPRPVLVRAIPVDRSRSGQRP